ncbi:MAG TPA: prolyl oligopeptidase family serine peptidase [Candidatus Dormibacteraeota bacterium]
MSEQAAWRRRFRAPSITLPAWARDAPDRLLHASNESGRMELHTWDRGTGQRQQVTDRPEGTTIGALDPAGEVMWWFDDERGNEFGTWRVGPFAGGGPARVAAPGVEPGYIAGLALAHGFAIVGTSTDAGSRIWLSAPEAAPRLLYQHREDADVAGLSRDETLVALSHSEHGDSRHPALRVVGLSGHGVADLWDGAGLGLTAGPWSPIAGDQRLVVQHERSGLSRPAVWAPPAGDLTELALDLPGEVRAADWYPDADALLLVHDHAGRRELFRYDLGTRRLEPLDAPAGTIAAALVRPDGRLWIQHSSGATPTRLLEDGRTLLEPPGPPPPPGVAYQDVRAGQVHGFLAEPEGPRPHPTLVLVHGGPTSHDRDQWSPVVQAWVDHGFAVALVNYRGSTGYGREWRDALEADPGLTEIADVRAVRDHLVAAGIADPARLVLGGGSWGGYLTLLGLGRQPEAWSLGIAIVPVADYVAAFEDEMEPLKAFDRALFGGTPAERPEFYRERSPITYVEQVRVPVLVMAGRNDPRCPIRQIENYLARLRELGKPHDYYEFEAGHSSQVVDEKVRQLEAQIAFVHRHLGTPAPL